MAQLTKEQAKLFPNPSSDIYVINHFYNEGHSLQRMIDSVLPLTDKFIFYIDDKTDDNTEEIAINSGAKVKRFKWKDNFAYAKNLVTREVPEGAWCLVLGGDMELQPHTVKEIKDFCSDPLNVAAKFQIPEYNPDPKAEVVTRPRTLLWRSHPFLYWERLVHEEMYYSLYRMLAKGIDYTKDKGIPKLGGENGILHYGDHEDSLEYKWFKRCYYLVLFQLDRVMRMYNYPETLEGVAKAIKDIGEESVEQMTKKYMEGKIPPGLASLYDYVLANPMRTEYD